MRSLLEREVLSRIRPTKEEESHIQDVARKILSFVKKSGKADAMIVGSVARGTWIHGDRDLDIFLLFDPSLTREQLEEEGLSLAREIASKEASGFREKYAEHPYINATIDSLDVDLVPCYRVESASCLQSAVDRTPFHTRYIRERIPSYLDDVLLLKQFAKAGGIYGSDQMTEGFSGYLCELLVLHCKGFRPLLEAAAEWRPGVVLDLESHQSKKFSEPLVVVDPVDPGRNVSASVSLSRFCEFIELASGYLSCPSPRFFSPAEVIPLPRDSLEGLLSSRGTFLYAVTFRTPPYIADIVVPQLRKSLESICGLLERHGFSPNRADCEMHEERSILLFELLVDRLPSVRRHAGPPVWNRVNSEKFTRKYFDAAEDGFFTGPFIEQGKYVVEIRRSYTHAAELLRSGELLEVALGRHVKIAMEGGWEVSFGSDCWDPEFAGFLTLFLMKSSPLTRILRDREKDPGSDKTG